MGRKNTGCIRERGAFQFRASITPDGREKSKTCSTQKEAQDWIDGLIGAHFAGEAEKWLAGRKLMLGGALERYLDVVTSYKKSSVQEARNIRAFLKREEDLCRLPMHEVHVSHVKKLIERRTGPQASEKGISGSTMNRELLRRFGKWVLSEKPDNRPGITSSGSTGVSEARAAFELVCKTVREACTPGRGRMESFADARVQ